MFEAWTLREDQVRKGEESLRRELCELSDEQRAAFYRQYNKELRDPDTFAVLNWLFLTGLHHFYLGRWLRGLINLVVMITGITVLFVGFAEIGFWVIVAILLIELPALFRSQIIVADYNINIGKKILTRL